MIKQFSDMEGCGTRHLELHRVEGDYAPRLPEHQPLRGYETIITEKGTVGGRPIVDILMVDPDGKKYFISISGQLVTAIAEVVAAANVRNHGKPYP